LNAGKIAKTVAQVLAILLLLPLLLFACGLGLCGVITATGNLPVGGGTRGVLYGLGLIVSGVALGGAAIYVVVLLFRRRPPKP